MKKLLFIISIAILAACQSSPNLDGVAEKPAVAGLLSAIQLKGDSTNVVLTDYFPDNKVVDSITTPDFFRYSYSPDSASITLITNNLNLHPLSIMQVWVKGNERYDLLIRKNKKLPVTFTFDPAGKKLKSVQLAGQINDWNPNATSLAFDGKVFKTTLLLNPGKYHYQVVVNGKWMLDPANPLKEDNGMGGQNSVVVVGNLKPNMLPKLVALSAQKNILNIKATGSVDSIIVLWQNHLLTGNFITRDSDMFHIAIPRNAEDYSRSYIRVWAYNKFGESNDLLIPLEGCRAVEEPGKLTRSDKHTQVMYFLMVDRFNNGTKANDRKVDDPEILPKANYFGGDLVGVTQKIKDGYFTSLGINTIWLSPITQNPLGAWGLYPNPRTKFSGYHGYWPVSLTKIDFRYGTDGDLQELIEEAHKRNINVILDYVANHIHLEHPLYKEHPDWTTSLYLPDGSLNTERWDEYRLTTWFDVFLPTLDLQRPEVYEPMTDTALYWLTNFKLDGFRHDATKHIHENFWRRLTQKIKLKVTDRSIYQIGETYGSRELVASYIGSGMLDSQFDFNIYDASVAAFARKDYPFSSLNSSLLESFSYFGWNNLMGYISGNQDRGRFISYAGGALRFDEDAKKAGWTREIGVGDTSAYCKLCMLNAFNLTIPGVPTIYYGDEFGMPGGNDPDNRRMMKFDSLTPIETRTLDVVKKLVNLRRNTMALNYGNFETLLADSSQYAYARTYLQSSAIVIFNKSDENQSITFKIPDYMMDRNFNSQFGSNFSIQNQIVKVDLRPSSFEVLISK